MKAPLKSPLAMPSGAPVAPADYPADIEGAVLASVVLSDRNATLAEFEDYLRTVNNRDGRPYEEKTISNYVGPGKNLDVWMTASGLDGDFTVLDVATLNRYFREYYLAHGQGGTHTLQRNLIQLFNYLEHERGFASPYSGALNRYTPVKGRPKTLSAGESARREAAAEDGWCRSEDVGGGTDDIQEEFPEAVSAAVGGGQELAAGS